MTIYYDVDSGRYVSYEDTPPTAPLGLGAAAGGTGLAGSTGGTTGSTGTTTPSYPGGTGITGSVGGNAPGSMGAAAGGSGLWSPGTGSTTTPTGSTNPINPLTGEPYTDAEIALMNANGAAATSNALTNRIEAANNSQSIANQQGQFDKTFGQNAYQFAQNYGLSLQQFQWLQNYQQQTLDLQKRQQEQEQKNYLAQLRMNPVKWLEYNQAAGKPTVSQQWMESMGGPKAGTVISQPNSEGTDLPSLLNPSAQLYSNMSPTEQGQWQGYQQANKALSPEDSMWQLKQASAPGGRNTQLTYA